MLPTDTSPTCRHLARVPHLWLLERFSLVSEMRKAGESIAKVCEARSALTKAEHMIRYNIEVVAHCAYLYDSQVVQ